MRPSPLERTSSSVNSTNSGDGSLTVRTDISSGSDTSRAYRGTLGRSTSSSGGTLRDLAMRQLSINLKRTDSESSTDTATSGFRAGGRRVPKLSLDLLDSTSQSFYGASSILITKSDSQGGTHSPGPEVVVENKSRRPSLTLSLQSEGEDGEVSTPIMSLDIVPKVRPKPQLILSLISEGDESCQTPTFGSTQNVLFPDVSAAVNSAAAALLHSEQETKPVAKGRKPMNLCIDEFAEPVDDPLAQQVDSSFANNDGKSYPSYSLSNPSNNASLHDTGTPSNVPQISARGTFHLGDIRINSGGITPASHHASTPSAGEAPVMKGMDFLEIRPLGNGASGVVMEAVHVPTLTIVALKMLPVYSQEKCENLTRELVILHKNLAALSIVDNSLGGENENDGQTQGSQKCPNLLSLFNAFVNVKNGMVCLVMEYMDGGSLEDLVKNGGCNDEVVLSDIARQCLSGLAFLHKNKSVHRDIKPANILCSSSGIVKIADFGISKVMDGVNGFAKTFVGTVIYMSPERITASSYSYSSDIWSFGLTLLAVANGSFPLRVGSDTPGAGQQWGGSGGYWGMVEAVCDNEPPTTGPEFSLEFSEFIKSCLRKNPDERGTAEGLLEHEFILSNMAAKTPHVQQQDSPWGSDFAKAGVRTTSTVSAGIAFESQNSEEDEEHGQLSSSLESSMVKKVADKAKRAFEEQQSRPSLPTLNSIEETNEEMITIETIRTKHFENIVTKLIYRDVLDAEQPHSAKYGGTYSSSGKLIRKESTLDDEVGAQTIENVDDLFDGKRSNNDVRRRTPKKPDTSRNIKKFGRNNADLINSILMLQGEYDETNAESSGTGFRASMPKLTGPDLRKWQNLATQLHLPLDTVIQITEQKLQETLEKLRAEDVQNSYAMSIDAAKAKRLSPRGVDATIPNNLSSPTEESVHDFKLSSPLAAPSKQNVQSKPVTERPSSVDFTPEVQVTSFDLDQDDRRRIPKINSTSSAGNEFALVRDKFERFESGVPVSSTDAQSPAMSRKSSHISNASLPSVPLSAVSAVSSSTVPAASAAAVPEPILGTPASDHSQNSFLAASAYHRKATSSTMVESEHDSEPFPHLHTESPPKTIEAISDACTSAWGMVYWFAEGFRLPFCSS